jgi:hypothetical protein
MVGSAAGEQSVRVTEPKPIPEQDLDGRLHCEGLSEARFQALEIFPNLAQSLGSSIMRRLESLGRLPASATGATRMAAGSELVLTVTQ